MVHAHEKANIRVLALLLVSVLVSGMLPASAWAADTAAPGIEVTEPPEAPGGADATGRDGTG